MTMLALAPYAAREDHTRGREYPEERAPYRGEFQRDRSTHSFRPTGNQSDFVFQFHFFFSGLTGGSIIHDFTACLKNQFS